MMNVAVNAVCKENVCIDNDEAVVGNVKAGDDKEDEFYIDSHRVASRGYRVVGD